eukprot:gene59780-81790_t
MEALRFEGRFTYAVTVEKGSAGHRIPSMLLQPLVENALKHGAYEGGESLHIDVQFLEKDKELVCEVTDNGRGFITDNQDVDTPKGSLGLTLVKERLNTLSKLYGKKYDIVAGNKKDYGLNGKDEPQSREFIKSLISDTAPFIDLVGETGHVDEAVQLIGETQPGLVIMDIQLYGRSAFDVFKAI